MRGRDYSPLRRPVLESPPEFVFRSGIFASRLHNSKLDVVLLQRGPRD
jgi:hypothetical protein